MAKRLRCQLGFHRWQRLRNDDGAFYRMCCDCGKFRDQSHRYWLGMS